MQSSFPCGGFVLVGKGRRSRLINQKLAVIESVNGDGGKPGNTPMEFEYRKEGGKWKPVE